MKCALTFTLHALADQTIQQGATVIAKCWAAVVGDFELVLASGILSQSRTKALHLIYNLTYCCSCYNSALPTPPAHINHAM